MQGKVKIKMPNDPFILFLYRFNCEERPEWERKVLQWFNMNGLKLVVVR